MKRKKNEKQSWIKMTFDNFFFALSLIIRDMRTKVKKKKILKYLYNFTYESSPIKLLPEKQIWNSQRSEFV